MENFVPFLFFCLLILVLFYALLGIVFCFIYIYFFRPVARPDYSLVAGEYCMEKMKDKPIRKEFFYPAGNSVLKGYFYPNKNSEKLIVICHGFRSGADDFLPLIKELVNLNYNVFSYDATATFDSKGSSLIGMQEWLIDLDNTLNFIKQTRQFDHLKLYLIGHSLGGYAVLSVLSLHKDIYGVVALAPVNDAFSLMLKTARAKVGNIVSITKPFFYVVQKLSFGKYTEYNAIKGINSTTIPVLIVQGDRDRVVNRQKISVYDNKEKIKNKNAKLVQTKGLLGGHASLWHSKDSVKYKRQVDKGYIFYKKQLKSKKYSQKVKYFNGINNNLYSKANPELVKMIDFTFCL